MKKQDAGAGTRTVSLGNIDEEKAPKTSHWVASRKLRMGFLVMACLYCCGSQVPYGAPAAQGPAFLQHFGIGATELGTLYSVWSFPNLPLAFVTGVFVDRVGANWSQFIFNVIIVVGCGIMLLSGYLESYGVLLAGFATFGIGSGSILVSQQVHLTRWFKGKELAFSFGVASTILRMATFANYNLSPVLASNYGVAKALVWPLCVAAMAFFAGLGAWKFDSHRSKRMKKSEDIVVVGLWEYIKRTAREFRYMTSEFWILCIIVTCSSCAEFSFEMFAVEMWAGNMPHTPGNVPIKSADAGRAVSVASLLIISTCPFVSLVVDKYGHYPHFMIAGCICSCAAALLFLLLPLFPASGADSWPYVVSTLFGLSYAMTVAVTWPCVGYLVSEKVYGTAFGFICGVLYLGLFIFPFLLGGLRDWTGGWHWSCDTILLLSGLSLFFSIVILVIDNRNGGVLTWPYGRERQALLS